MSEEAMTPAEAMDALRNIVAMLQAEPLSYRRFGIWWWAVKRLLRAAGYTQAEVSCLGSYEDREQAAMIPDGPPTQVLADALEEQAFNARFGRAGGLVETPDGEVVRLRDQDAIA